MCDTSIRQTEHSASWTLFKSHSVYYSSGAGFFVLQGGKMIPCSMLAWLYFGFTSVTSSF
jgi:hypothetical protein